MNPENTNDNARTPNGSHRKESKRILTIIAVVLLMLIIWGICALAGSLMKVRKIEVTGNSPYTEEEIINVTGLETGMKINKVDKDSVEETILRKLTYISEVSVKSGLFGKIKVAVSSDEAVYYTKIAGEYYAMSSDFRLLTNASNSSAFVSGNLICISLPKIKTAILGDYIVYYDISSEFVAQLMEDINTAGILTDISAVDAQDKYSIEITYGKFTVKIGAYKDIGTKLSLASQMANDNVLSDVDSAILDVSDPANATIRFK